MRVGSGAAGFGKIANFCDRATCRPAGPAFVDGGRRVPILGSPGGSSRIVKVRFTAARCLTIMRRCYQYGKKGS